MDKAPPTSTVKHRRGCHAPSKSGWQRSSSSSSGAPASDVFRSCVLRMRSASDPESLALSAAGLREALLQAAHADAALDDGLLGMAASQCVRHQSQELLGLLCAHTVFRLGSCSGRTVAELASAAVKLDCVDVGFAFAVTGFCTSPQPGTFGGLRDVVMLASAVRAFSGVDHAAALCGLAEAARPHIGSNVAPRDLAELAHHFVNIFVVQCCCCRDRPSGKFAVLRDIIPAALNHFKRRLHLANARDVAMVAGAIGTVWPVWEAERETTLRPVLLDVAQLTRFRRADFNPQDLTSLAMAFAKAEMANPDLADVLNDQTASQLAKFSSKSIANLLWSAAKLEDWAAMPFVSATATYMMHCDFSRFAAHDLCASAQSLAKLGTVGLEPLQRVAEEAFQRQLRLFTSNDKALLLWALAKVKSKYAALLRILVRSLAVENCCNIDRELASAALWALARVWKQLVPTDPWSQSLLSTLCALCPWNQAAAFEVCCASWAVGQLPVCAEEEVWASLLISIRSLAQNVCSLHALSLLLSGLSTCPAVHAATRDEMANRFINEMVHVLRSSKDKLSEYDVSLLDEGFRRASWHLPPEISIRIPPHIGQEDLWCGTCREDLAEPSPSREVDISTALQCHGSSHGHTHDHNMVAMAISTSIVTDGHGHDNCHGHSHGHGHECDGMGHGHSFSECTDECGHDCCNQVQIELTTDQCCPRLFESNTFGEIRLNGHCDFHGHCIQMKNTFIHVQCNHSDSETAESGCLVCKMTRSRSCDDIDRRRDSRDAFLPVLMQPPGLVEPSDSSDGDLRGRQRHRASTQPDPA